MLRELRLASPLGCGAAKQKAAGLPAEAPTRRSGSARNKKDAGLPAEAPTRRSGSARRRE
jgi:hypothetical protein